MCRTSAILVLWTLHAMAASALSNQHIPSAGLWPQPTHTKAGEGVCRLRAELDIEWPGEAATKGLGFHIVDHLRSRLADPSKGFRKKQPALGASSEGLLSKLRIESSGIVENLALDVAESYELQIPQCTSAEQQIVIRAETALGVSRAIETLLQLIIPNSQIDETHNSPYFVAGLPWFIQDSPRFPHRGLLLDTSRNFFPVHMILETIEAMALNKMSVLHWHIVDAPSFPFQSASVPHLSASGAYSPQETYSPTDVEEVIHHAFKRGVRVIPEFDMPGHAYSWGLGDESITTCSNKQPWQLYCAAPPCGQLDPTVNSTYDIISDLLGDVTALFPDDYIHLGADEVNYACWEEDPGLAERAEEKGMSMLELWGHFEQRVLDMSRREGKTTILWQDAWEEGVQLPQSTVLQVWKELTDAGHATAAGHEVIVSNHDAWYLDCGAGNWVTGEKSWCDPFKSWEVMLANDILEHVEEEHQHLVLGGEACMWTEQTDPTNLHSKVWPRAAAVAEALWNPSGREDVPAAKERLAIHRLRLREDWDVRMDWWCDEAVDHSWDYGGDGSLRNGNRVIAKSQVLTRQRRAVAPVSSGGDPEEEEEMDAFLSFAEGREGMLEEDYFEPFIPHIRSGNIVGVQLCNKSLTFTINGEPVEGQIEGIEGRVRLAVQMEEEGDAIVILPDVKKSRASSPRRSGSMSPLRDGAAS